MGLPEAQGILRKLFDFYTEEKFPLGTSPWQNTSCGEDTEIQHCVEVLSFAELLWARERDGLVL